MSRSHTRVTHTYVILELSPAAFAEIRQKLLEAGYTVEFDEEKREVIDMHGIAVAEEKSNAIRNENESAAEETESYKPWER